MGNKLLCAHLALIILCNINAMCVNKVKYDKIYKNLKSDNIRKREITDNVMNEEPEEEDFNGTVTSVFHHKKCKLLNVTEEPPYDTKRMDSIYLNNIYTGVTTNLINNKDIEELEAEGISLYEIVKSNCGSAKICPNIRRNFTDSNVITIGFLSAYGWSQVSSIVSFSY